MKGVNMNKIKFYFITLVVFLLSCEFSYSQKKENQNSSTNNTTTTNSNFSPPKNNEPLTVGAFIELAKIANPAVVNISTSTQPRRGRNMGRDPFFDMLEQFYGFRGQAPQPRPQTALGTGFIIREDGLIVTNNHVISGADVINIQLSENSNKTYQAKLVGSDERTDIALIKINVDFKLPFIKLGSSKDVQVGEWVAAFGNPFGQGHTMTKGIISAKGRDISEINRFPLLQTDTPINPGNSGGPLVNLRGEVIGVNSAINAQAQGIGYAIPIDEVKAIIPQLEKTGRIKKGYLGVGLAELHPDAAAQLGLKDNEGVVIVEVDRNGPAGRAGFKPYDIVVEVNGKKIKNSLDLQDEIAGSPIGENTKVKIIREGKTLNLEVKVAERPDQRSAARPEKQEKKYEGQKAPFEIGFSMVDLNSDTRKEFQVNNDIKGGAIVIETEENKPAARAGLSPGDVIIDVNKTEVKNSRDVIRNFKRGTNTIRIVRGNSVIILMVRTIDN